MSKSQIGPKKIKKAVAEKKKESEADVEFYKSSLSLARRQIKTLQKELGKDGHFTEQMLEAIKAAPVPPRFKYQIPKSVSSEVSVVSIISDWHVDEVVSKSQTEGFGGFNWNLAQTRVFDLAKRVNDWTNTQRHGYKINDLHIFGLSDYISGGIHPELEITNSMTTPVAIERAGWLVGEYTRRLSSNFKNVKFAANSGDNHGRRTHKPRYKDKVLDNYSYLIHKFAETYCKDLSNVDFYHPDAAKFIVPVQGYKFLIEHGDTVRGWNGIPFYGLDRRKAQEALRRMGTTKAFDYWCVGHFHTPNLLGNLVMNGSLGGTTELDHLVGRSSAPCQVAFLVHPKYGLFNFVEFWL